MQVTQTASGTWVTDSTIETDIERVGVITRIDATVELIPSATLDGANQEDGLFRLVQNLTVRGSSGTYMTLPADDSAQGGNLLHQLNIVDGHGVGHEDGIIVAPRSLYIPVNFVLHPGSRPRNVWGGDNPYDLSAIIPAHAEGQLTASWKVSGNDVVDDTVTITSAIMRYTISRVTGTHDEIVRERNAQGVRLPDVPGITAMIPAWSAQVFAISGTSADFDAQKVDVIGGGWLKRVTVLAQDAVATVANRASDEIVEIRIRNVNQSEDLLRVNVEAITAHLPAASNLEADDAGPTFNLSSALGVYPIDLRPMTNSGGSGQDYGFNMNGVAKGEMELGFVVRTNAAGDDALILWERNLPTGVALGRRGS